MGRVLVFLLGLFAGASLAHVASRTSAGVRVVAAADGYVRAVTGVRNEFVAAVSDSYRARLAERD